MVVFFIITLMGLAFLLATALGKAVQRRDEAALRVWGNRRRQSAAGRQGSLA